MKTLNLEGFRVPIAKILAKTFLVSSLTIIPQVWAEDTQPSVTSVIMQQFKLSASQVDSLMLAQNHATESNQPEAIMALMLQESGANINAPSAGNCHGLMQIMTSTAQGVLRSDKEFQAKYFGNAAPAARSVTYRLKTDAVFSIEVADKILAQSLRQGNSLDHAILAYNVGSTRASRLKSANKYPYVRSVLNNLHNIVKPIRMLLESTNL